MSQAGSDRGDSLGIALLPSLRGSSKDTEAVGDAPDVHRLPGVAIVYCGRHRQPPHSNVIQFGTGGVVVARPLPEVQDTQTLSIMGALGRMCLRVVGVAGCCNRCSRNDLTSNFACCVIRQLGTALELPSWAGSGGTGVRAAVLHHPWGCFSDPCRPPHWNRENLVQF